MDVVLATHEVPHEVSPVHPIHLVVEEEGEVCAHGRLACLRAGHLLALALGVGLIEFGMFLACVAPHAREEHLAAAVVGCIRRAVHLLVLAVHRSPVLGRLQLVRRVIVLPVDERSRAVLLAREVAHEGEGIVRLVLVGRSLRAAADDVHGKYGEAYNDDSQAGERRVEQYLAFLQGREHAPDAEREHRNQEEGGAAVVRQTQSVHEEEVEVGGQLREPRYDAEQNHRKDDHAYEEDLHVFPEGVGRFLAEIVHEHQGRDGQQVQQVHSYAQAHEEGYQHYPPVGVRFVGLVVPLGHGPEHQRSEEAGHGIDLALHGREPEGVGEAVGEGPHQTAAEDGNGRARAVAPVLSWRDEPAHEPYYSKVEEEYGERRAQRAHGVDQHRRMGTVTQHGEDAREKLEHRVSRRVPHFQFV